MLKSLSPLFNLIISGKTLTLCNIFPCVKTTPFGFPVVPEVYIIVAIFSLFNFLDLFIAKSSFPFKPSFPNSKNLSKEYIFYRDYALNCLKKLLKINHYDVFLFSQKHIYFQPIPLLIRYVL